jgi:hypothetical protein
VASKALPANTRLAESNPDESYATSLDKVGTLLQRNKPHNSQEQSGSLLMGMAPRPQFRDDAAQIVLSKTAELAVIPPR